MSRTVAPIIVSNHVSYTDPIFFFYELFPSIVASETHDKIPLVGTIIRAMQVSMHILSFFIDIYIKYVGSYIPISILLTFINIHQTGYLCR